MSLRQEKEGWENGSSSRPIGQVRDSSVHNSHARGLFTGHQSFLEGVPPLYTSNCCRNSQPESISRMGTRVLIEFPGATAPVFSGTSAALFYWPSLTGPQQVPTGKEGYLLSEKEIFLILDFSGIKTNENMKMICPARKPSEMIEERRKKKRDEKAWLFNCS